MPTPTYASEQTIKYLFSATSLTRPAAWTIALHTGDPGAAGTANELTVGTDANYVRKAVTFATALNGAVWEAKNSGAVVFDAAAAGSSYTITHFTVRDGSGNVLAIAQLPVAQNVTAAGVINFAINDIVVAGASV